MKNYFSFFILFILVNLAAKAQDEPLFSNYMFLRTITNPGFVGAENTINATFCNRTMFAGFEGKPVTSTFGVEAPIDLFGKKTGIGIIMMSDKIGFQQIVKVDLSFAYHHSLKNGTLGFGLTLGLNNYSIDPGKWNGDISGEDGSHTWATSGDPLIPQAKFPSLELGIGFGAYYETTQYYLGLSGSNLNRASISNISSTTGLDVVYSYYPAVYKLSGAYNIELPDPLIDLRPSFILRSDLIVYMLDMNATIFYKKRYWAGFGLRVSPKNIASFTLLGGIELMNSLNVGYALDINTSNMIYNGATSHEVIITYSFNIDTKRDMKYKSVRYL
jgi:type IX secretion system PorP/SprF family membrane protein